MIPDEDTDRRTVLKTIGAGVAGAAGLAGTASAARGDLEAQLAAVRSATAAYNDPATAVAEGYQASDHAVCGMGFHYPNFGLLGVVDRTRPQVLVYGEDDDGDLVLGAVEYIVPRAGPYESSPPDLFDGDGGDEEWSKFGPDFWALHVWVHNHNPKGVFNSYNPRELFCPEGSDGH